MTLQTGTAENDLGQTTTSRIEARMRQEIASGTLVGGQRIKIADLAQRYGISHLPIREALRSLAADGLIDLQSHKGATIFKVDADFVSNIYEARGAIETYLIEKCCERVTAEALARIAKLRDRFEEEAITRDVQAMVMANSAFHSEINNSAGNPLAARMIGVGWELVSSLRIRFGYSEDRIEQIVLDHRKLVQAFENRDKRMARAVSVEHCEMAKLDLLRMLAV